MSDETKAISYDELDSSERVYVTGQASALGVSARHLSPVDIGRMLERFYAGESDVQRLHRSLQFVHDEKQKEREAQEPHDPLEGLPSESERYDVAKKLNVLPQFVRTREQAEQELAEQKAAQEAELGQQLIRDAVAGKDSKTLMGMILHGKEPGAKNAARAALKEVWPGAPDWLIEPESEE